MDDLYRALCTFRQQTGATFIEIEHSGSGDSGGVDSITSDGAWLPAELENQLNEFAYDNIDTGYDNDGGGGTITIDLDKMTVHFEEYEYVPQKQESLDVTRYLTPAGVEIHPAPLEPDDNEALL